MGRGRRRLGVWWTIYVEHYLRKKAERFWMWIAWHLPKVLVKWCYVRVGSHATTGEYGSTVVPEITMIDALKRWDDDECGKLVGSHVTTGRRQPRSVAP